ncbi:hypothetical protein [Archaeoglobus neptunius]|uniref:hypothetical protein n=1 Tax=Archaeoglobus neptunius TaxID=2798580 RepID=UPI001927E74E|nr:hypothetical protein [Archaeoglobus neptunius]
MLMSLDEFARIVVALLNLNFQAVQNLLDLFVSASTNSDLNFSNVWGLIYGGIVMNYWNNHILMSILEVTRTNASAMRNFSLTFSYLGSNATVIFGDVEGTKGMSYLQSGIYQYLAKNPGEIEKLASNLTKMFKTQAEFLVRLMKSVNSTFT